jgi:hypothetical protein
MGYGKENTTKFKNYSLFKNRKGDFSLRVRAEPYYHILLLLIFSEQCYYQGSKGERYPGVKVIRFKETLQKGVCDKEYP